MMLRRLSYRSIRSPSLDDTQLFRDIIHPAAAKNEKLGITSCLWFGAGSFVQVIEGQDEHVHRLIGSIIADPRHRAVVVIADQLVRSRMFKTWSFKAISEPEHVDTLACAVAARIVEACGYAAGPPPTLESLIGECEGEPESAALIRIFSAMLFAPAVVPSAVKEGPLQVIRASPCP